MMSTKINPGGIDKVLEVPSITSISSGEEKLQPYSNNNVKLILKKLLTVGFIARRD